MRKIITIAGSALAALALAATAACGSTASASDPSPVKPHTSAAPKPDAPSTAERMSAWWDAAHSDFEQWQKDQDKYIALVSEDTAAVITNPDKAIAILQDLQDDIDTLKAAGPMPDSSVQSDWSSALGHFAKSYRFAEEGLTDFDVSKISKSTEQMRLGTADLKLVTAAVDALA